MFLRVEILDFRADLDVEIFGGNDRERPNHRLSITDRFPEFGN